MSVAQLFICFLSMDMWIVPSFWSLSTVLDDLSLALVFTFLGSICWNLITSLLSCSRICNLDCVSWVAHLCSMQGQLEHLELWSALHPSLSGGSLTFYLVVDDPVVRTASGADTHDTYVWSLWGQLASLKHGSWFQEEVFQEDKVESRDIFVTYSEVIESACNAED